tara:strand:+ start:107 stop:334 length:228 start_codon:yes stop_codon:yes gene_type:complete
MKQFKRILEEALKACALGALAGLTLTIGRAVWLALLEPEVNMNRLPLIGFAIIIALGNMGFVIGALIGIAKEIKR